MHDYLHAQRVLHQYGNLPSFQGIKTDCESILADLKVELSKQFSKPQATARELAESVDLLLQLDEPAIELCSQFLVCAEARLAEQLVMLKDESEQRDLTEFVDLSCSGFLNDLCLVVASFHDMFVNRASDHHHNQLDNVDNRWEFKKFNFFKSSKLSKT